MNDNNTFKMADDGAIRFSYNGKECLLTEEMLKKCQSDAVERVSARENLSKLEAALETISPDSEEYKSINNSINTLNKEIEDKRREQKEYLERTGTPYTKLADAMNNEILTPIVAFAEAFFKKRKEAKSVYKDPMMAKIGEEFYEALRKNDGERFMGLLEAANPEASSLTLYNTEKEKKSLILVTENGGVQRAGIFSDEQSLKDYLKKNFQDRNLKPEKSWFYSMDGSKITEELKQKLRGEKGLNHLLIASGAEPEGAFTNTESKIDTKQENVNRVEDYNTMTRNTLMRYAETEKMKAAIAKTDYTILAQRGINLSAADEESLRKLANGGTSNLLPTIMKDNDGNILKGECKVKLYQTEQGYKIGVFDKMKTPQIPEKIGGQSLSLEQIKQIREKGSLKRPIRIEMNGREMLLMPYLDKETNQVFTRDMRRLQVEKQYKGAEITAETRERIVHGETVEMKNLTDKQGQVYTGYVRINPMNGKIEEYIKPNMQYERQVAANNNGERTTDLSHDKDTVLKSGQQRNDDPKAPKKKIQYDKANKKVRTTNFRQKFS